MTHAKNLLSFAPRKIPFGSNRPQLAKLRRATAAIVTCAAFALPSTLASASASFDPTSGDYSSWDSFKNLFSPKPADDPITKADEKAVPIPYTAPSASFNDGFKPGLYNVWQEVIIDPATGAKCGDGSPYKFWIKRSPSTSNIQLSLAGGGACWDYKSCSRDLISGGFQNVFKPDGEKDLEGLLSSTPLNAGKFLNSIMMVVGTGMLRQFDPWMDNRAQKWTKVYLPYCTGDVHIGLNTKIYEDPAGEGEPVTVHHVGAINMLQAAAWMRNNLETPKQVMGNGISAGGIGIVALYHAMRKLVKAERGYLVDDAGPAWFAEQGTTPAELAPSQFLHDVALASWGTTAQRDLVDGSYRSFVEWYEEELPGFRKENFGTINSALAEKWQQDRFGFMTTQEDLLLASFSYRKFFPQTYTQDNEVRRRETFKLWQTDVDNFVSNMQGTQNYGYYLPATRKFLSGHVVSALPDASADIQELGLTTDDFVDSILDNDAQVIQAKETDFEADRKQFEPIGALTDWIFSLAGL